MKRALVTSLVGMVFLAVFMSSQVYATRLGGKFVQSGTTTYLKFSYGGAHNYYGNVWQGAANWRATPTDIDIQPWPGAPSAIHIDVYDTYTSDTWWGATFFNPCSTCTYHRNYFYLNERTLKSESDFTRTKVATHEFGHAIGLAHAISGTSIMQQGHLSFNTPRTYDINDVNWIY